MATRRETTYQDHRPVGFHAEDDSLKEDLNDFIKIFEVAFAV
jgi:hypothetical protein